MPRIALVAIGGNSITKAGQIGTIPEQFANTEETAEHIANMIAQGWDVVITHGNGPQIGNVLLRVELSQDHVYPLPLDTCGSDTQGGMGYMIQQVLGNVLRRKGIRKNIATVITQVVVDKSDPAFQHPTKPIGPFYSLEKAERYRKEKGWKIIEDAGRGYRRVVPSPIPQEIVERQIIKQLIHTGNIVIAVGGGGIPVVRLPTGDLKGIEAVIDKDYASSLLANDIEAKLFLITTDVEKVALNYNTPTQIDLDELTVEEAKRYFSQNHFPAGSMGPKITAAIQYLERGGKEVIITSPECIEKAINRETGTRIIP